MTNYNEIKKLLDKEQITSEDFMIVYEWITRKFRMIKEALKSNENMGLMAWKIREDIDVVADVISELEVRRERLTQVVEKNIDDYLEAFKTKLEEVKELWRDGLR